MNFTEIFSKTVTKGTDDKILQVIWITIWIKEFFMDFFINALISNTLSALVSKTGRKKILKPKKILKRHHNPTVSSLPDMKTHYVHLLLGCSNNIVSRCFDLTNILTIFFKDHSTLIFAQTSSICRRLD